MSPTLANGKICYIEIPASDIARSADFYRRVFGCQIRQRGDGSTAFGKRGKRISLNRALVRGPNGSASGCPRVPLVPGPPLRSSRS
jgi:uncharacterized protein